MGRRTTLASRFSKRRNKFQLGNKSPEDIGSLGKITTTDELPLLEWIDAAPIDKETKHLLKFDLQFIVLPSVRNFDTQRDLINREWEEKRSGLEEEIQKLQEEQASEKFDSDQEIKNFQESASRTERERIEAQDKAIEQYAEAGIDFPEPLLGGGSYPDPNYSQSHDPLIVNPFSSPLRKRSFEDVGITLASGLFLSLSFFKLLNGQFSALATPSGIVTLSIAVLAGIPIVYMMGMVVYWAFSQVGHHRKSLEISSDPTEQKYLRQQKWMSTMIAVLLVFALGTIESNVAYRGYVSLFFESSQTQGFSLNPSGQGIASPLNSAKPFEFVNLLISLVLAIPFLSWKAFSGEKQGALLAQIEHDESNHRKSSSYKAAAKALWHLKVAWQVRDLAKTRLEKALEGRISKDGPDSRLEQLDENYRQELQLLDDYEEEIQIQFKRKIRRAMRLIEPPTNFGERMRDTFPPFGGRKN